MEDRSIFWSPAKVDLIESGEHLFGEHGIEGVSLRRIHQLAGNANVAAAQYHFGTKEGLLEAILKFRRPQFDAMRREFFPHDADIEDASVEQLIEAIYRPFLIQKNRWGRRSFCRFQEAVFHYRGYSVRFSTTTSFVPVTNAIYLRMRRLLPDLPEVIWQMRVQASGRFAVNMIADFDRGWIDPELDQERILNEIIVTMSAALRAPQSDRGPPI